MFRWLEVDLSCEKDVSPLAEELASMLDQGCGLDLTLATAEAIVALEDELAEIASFAPGGRIFSQILAASGSPMAVFTWGDGVTTGIRRFYLREFSWVNRICSIAFDLAEGARTPPQRPCLLSLIPSIRRHGSIPRFFHRESHTELGQLNREANLPRIYKLTIDVGIRNSCKDVNVSLVPRWAMLSESGEISRDYIHLFQRDWIDYSNLRDNDGMSSPGEICEDSLPFPETSRDLEEGHAFVWRDDLFFHSVYLKRGRTLQTLKADHRSVLIVNQFDGEQYEQIPWTDSVRREIVELMKP